MRPLLVGLAISVVTTGLAFAQTKPPSATTKATTAQWGTKILLNDDWLGIYKDKEWSELSPDTRARIIDHREAATKFGTAFALERSCQGLTLLFQSRAGSQLSPGRYWWLNLNLGTTKETTLEKTDREVKTFNEQGRVPYVHIDNPWFNWSIEHYTSPRALGERDEFEAEDSDPSPEGAARRVCLLVKSGGAVFGATGASSEAGQSARVSSAKSPSATEVFHLRSECSELGKRLLEEVSSNLPKDSSDSFIKKSQLSHYNPTVNRCYVQVTLAFQISGSPYTNTVVVLFDGQTQENLASLGMKGTGCPDGKECTRTGSIHDTTQHPSVDDNREHALKFMDDAMEYGQRQ
jgi:hypothetical protein